MNGMVRASIFDDGGGPALYAVENYDRRWRAIISRNGRCKLVRSARTEPGQRLAVSTMGRPALYAGGHSPLRAVKAIGLAKWDGANWSALGTGVFFSYLPRYTMIVASAVRGDTPRHHSQCTGEIAKWDGANWSAWAGTTGIGVRASVRRWKWAGLAVGGTWWCAWRAKHRHRQGTVATGR
jgi:hypothetical protein